METLLDIDYTVRDEKAVIRLYYKVDKGREIREIDDFEPHFYVTSDDLEGSKKNIEKLDGVVKVETVKKVEVRQEIEVLKVTVKLPQNVPELRGEIKEFENTKEVREAAIPFAERYLINSGIVPMEDAEQLDLRIASFDLEVYNPRGEPKSEKDPLLMISYADSTGLKKVWTYRETPGVSLDYLEILSDEKEVIKRLIQTVKEQEIDILCTYNGDNFDFPYLNERAAKYKMDVGLGIDGSKVRLERRGMNLGAKVRGRPHIDLYPICRQVFNLSRYTLENVYLEMFGEEKKDINAAEMHKIWDANEPGEMKEVFEYSMADAVGTLRMGLAILPLQYELSRITRIPVYKSSRSGSGQRVEDLLIKRAYEKNILIPNKPSDRIATERQKSSYVGAYVVEPKRGIHDNIVLFDFRSLYPSIIISHNIDPSAMNCACCKKEEAFQSPAGHHFCKKNVGLIPETVGELIQRRIEAKKRLKEESDPEKKRFLDVEQQALKLLSNSMYGYFAFARAVWYSRECAEAIAALGRQYIHNTIEAAQKHGFDVLYGDTDSIYITVSGEKDSKKIIAESKKFSGEINKELPGGMELEFEGFYPRGIFITKKRYALMDEKGTLLVKGLEVRRRDWSNVAKETQTKVLNALLKDKDPEKAAEIVKGMVQMIKTGDVKLDDLTIHTQITRGMNEYVQAGPHIVAARKAIKEGREFKQGDIVTYVVTKTGTSISDRARVVDFVEEGDYDANYYINNQVLPAVMRILEALGYSEDELKGLGKQMTLGGF
ncbi:MAG: DNA-directed DNA polymerase [Candidatus Altiarchaeales archaeon]|nr:DNA-directed DNA polymerase [Candidatus Altiarchaeota archaeon]MBU4341528.1 DNA-directed DNA polymerase [Candidatus Altiarchaeota archaeon]MBU4436995.1 DNA-directed DNA polymerase [Candidatus Altiarchaeota archaeon]MCG2782209.1 DNA-directed DNA polymerase [Candidatus Altiarchaeales archaeon]